MEYFKQIQSHLSKHNLPSIITLWEEYCLSDEIDLEELNQILKTLKDTPYADSFGRYVDQILALWEKAPESEAKDEAFKLITDIQSTNTKHFADLILHYLEKKYSNDKDFTLKLKMVGLKDQENFRGAVRNFELLNHMKKGNFVYHHGGWGAGEIMDVSFIREELSLEFENVAGRKDLSFNNAFKTLSPIASNHFLALRFGNPDKLEKMARDDSATVIRLLLKDLGPKTASEIKDELADVIIPEEEWSKWWQNARARLKKDTLIESPSQLKNPFKLRHEELSHEERLIHTIQAKEDPYEIIDVIYSALRDFPSVLKNKEFKDIIRSKLKETLINKGLSTSQELQLIFLLIDIGGESEVKTLESMIASLTNIEAVLDQIEVIAFKKRLLQELQKIKSNWTQIYIDLLLKVDQHSLRDFIFTELTKAGKTHEIKAKLEELILEPHLSPQAFLWYFQKIMEKTGLPFSDQDGKNRFLESFFALLYIVEQNPDERETVKKLLNFFTTARYANIRAIFQGASLEVVQEILLLSTKCQSLSDHDIKILHSLAEVVHPSLSKHSQTESQIEDDESVIWSTEAGYIRLKERIHHIATVETVDNAREIEVARSHGDLRENSEYKFALERRARLQSEIKTLSDQLNKMRILTEDDIDTTKVGVGTIITLKNPIHGKTVYTLLGPWDTDLDNNILAFQSKVAQNMKGKKIGDKITLQNEDWVVEKIESFLNK
jgi:transcription elongation factor GreA-like protein/transcription elongation GreA/GreB family factor